jgi:hypothetical protein
LPTTPVRQVLGRLAKRQALDGPRKVDLVRQPKVVQKGAKPRANLA